MIVLQAGHINGDLVVWGESPSADNGTSASGNGRSNKAHVSPHDAGVSLPAVLAEVVGKGSKAKPLVAWLPTVKGRPVASTPLIAEPPTGKAAAQLAPWKVTGISLRPDQALDFLSHGVGKETLAPGLVIGRTLAYWIAAFRFAGAMVTRERFLPGLDTTGKQAVGAWEPVIDGGDQQRLLQLAKSMPPACRALADTDEKPPESAAQDVLLRFVQQTTDCLVRQATAAWPNGKKSFDSIHDEWLHRLMHGDGKIKGQSSEQTKLVEQLETWRRPLAITANAPFRLCFRLEEPVDETAFEIMAERESIPRRKQAADWYLRYLLQGVEDPSLQVDVGKAWAGQDDKVLQRQSFNSHEYLLSALGQAASIWPELETSLKTDQPAGHSMDGARAFEFLMEKAWLLDQAGFAVMLPSWWTRKGTKLRLSMRANAKSPKLRGESRLSMDKVIQFDWQVALGDQALSLDELELLARLKTPLVKFRGQWVQVQAGDIQAALEFWKKQASNQATMREVVQMALGGQQADTGLPISGVTADGWIGEFLGQLEGQRQFEELPTADSFHGELRPYQVRGYSWLAFLRRWGLGACLADDMGLGKTVQTLALIQRDWQENDKRPTLLVCPMSVVGNWQKEAERFTPDLPVLVHHGANRLKGLSFRKQAREASIVGSSFPLLHRDFETFHKVKWAGIILDEAQNIKNPETKQAKSARSLPADYRIALTGTPVENHVGDLWSIMEFLNPGFLGTQREFRRSYQIPIQAGQDPEAARRLQKMTGPFILRRLKTDKSIIADLPDKLEMKVFCNLTKEQASLYASVVADTNKELKGAEGIQRKGLILATLSKLKQVCNHPAQFLGDNSSIPDRSGKLARLTEMLEEVQAGGEKALIFTQFSEMGELIKRHLEESFGREVLFLHGGVAKKQRDGMVTRFQSNDDAPETPRVFVLSLKAGGTGLNLTSANHVFHFDRWWNPAVENQATDRAFRIGQTRNVQVHKYLCVGTVEEKIDEMIEQKKEIAGKVVGTGEAWLTELSNNQLKELFALRQDAVSD